MNLPTEIVEMLGQTLAKVVPVTIALALVFSVLAHFWACNPGRPWWRKRELVTDSTGKRRPILLPFRPGGRLSASFSV